MGRLDLRAFQRASATHVVSLGWRCATAYNIRRFFGFGGAFPFDWWITVEKGVAGVLDRPEVEYLYDPSELELCDDGNSVRHRSLFNLYHHEFPRARLEDGRCPIAPDWLSHIGRAKDRTSYLLSKLLALDAEANRVLFLRDLREGASAEGERQIIAALQKRFSRATWAYATIQGPKSDAQYGWFGNPTLWNLTLSPLGVVLDASAHEPFDPLKIETLERIG